jgi:uncharacterized protein involved in exopolysaccharide biosynthesis
MSDDRRTDAVSAAAGSSDGSDEDSFRWTQFRHFLHAPLRRPLLVLLPWAAVFGLSVAALLVLPKKYMSTALVLVESEKMPESFIPKVATRDSGLRLETIRPEILSRTRLEKVIDETQPYPGLGKSQAVDKMRAATFVNVSGSDGFTITFYHRDPLKAQEVTDRLARLFIDETIKSRAQQVEGAVDFLVTQVKDARVELENKDAAVRRYKEEHMGKLPSQLEANLATMQMLQREMQTVEESLMFAREKQEALARGVGVLPRPPLRRPRRPRGTPSSPELNQKLADLRTRYKDAHPDVESVRARIARLQARLERRGRRPPVAAAAAARSRERRTRRSSSPAISWRARTLEVRKLEERQRDLEGRIAAIRRERRGTPRTEQELATLTRTTRSSTRTTRPCSASSSRRRCRGAWRSDGRASASGCSIPPACPKAGLPEAVALPRAGRRPRTLRGSRRGPGGRVPRSHRQGQRGPAGGAGLSRARVHTPPPGSCRGFAAASAEGLGAGGGPREPCRGAGREAVGRGLARRAGLP